MNWKDRLKSDNESESGCYKFVLTVALLGFFVLLSQSMNSLNTPGKIVIGILALAGIIIAIALLMAGKLHTSFPISKPQSIWLSLISVTVIFGLFSILMIGMALLANSLKTFLPNWLVDIVWIGVFFILLFKFSEATRTLQDILLQKFLGIPTDGTNEEK